MYFWLIPVRLGTTKEQPKGEPWICKNILHFRVLPKKFLYKDPIMFYLYWSEMIGIENEIDIQIMNDMSKTAYSKGTWVLKSDIETF